MSTKRILFFATFLFCISGNAQQLNFEWNHQISGTNQDFGKTIASGPDGSVVSTGSFLETCDFDPGPATEILTCYPNPPFPDQYILKLDANGNFMWVGQLSGEYGEEIYDVTIDDNGDIYMVGSFGHTIDFDPGPGIYEMTGTGSSISGFILKLDANGNFLWAKSITPTHITEAVCVEVDDNDHVYVGGRFTGTYDFDNGPGDCTLTSQASNDGFLARYSADGVFQWCKQFSGNAAERISKVVYKNGELILGGNFNGITDADPGSGTFPLTPEDQGGMSDILVIKLDTAGSFLWAGSFGGMLNKDVLGVDMDPQGNVYLTGSFNGTVDFDPGAGTQTLSNSNFRQMYLCKLSTSGTLDFIHAFPAKIGCAIHLDEVGNIYSSGYFSGPADFDTGPGTYILNSNGPTTEVFICKMSSTGQFISAMQFNGTSSSCEAYDMDLGPDGSIYTTGLFSGTHDFDSGPGTTNCTAVGLFDAFVHKVNQATLGVPELTDSFFTLFPNPASGQVSMRFKSDMEQELCVYNSLGQIVTVMNLSAGEYESAIDLPFPKGVYHFSVTDRTGNETNFGKLVLQ